MDCDVPERATVRLTTTLRDLDEQPLLLSAIDTVTLTLYNDRTGEIVNGRLRDDIKNSNGGTVSSGGGLTLRLDPEDTVIIDDEKASELRVAQILWTWTEDSVEHQGTAEIAFIVRNLQQIPEEEAS
jgi:hypothetical protein